GGRASKGDVLGFVRLTNRGMMEEMTPTERGLRPMKQPAMIGIFECIRPKQTNSKTHQAAQRSKVAPTRNCHDGENRTNDGCCCVPTFFGQTRGESRCPNCNFYFAGHTKNPITELTWNWNTR